MDCFTIVRTCGLILTVFIISAELQVAKLPEIEIITAVALSSSEISLIWKSIPVLKRGKMKYVVRYKAKGESSQRVYTEKPEVTLKKMSKNSTYVITVRASKGKTRGDWSSPVEVKTKARVKEPQRVTSSDLQSNVTVDSVQTTSVLISWSLENQPIKGFKGFRVIVKNKKGAAEFNTDQSDMMVEGLHQGTKYTANVFMLKKSGSKIRLGAVRFTTLEEAIQAPKNLRIKSMSNMAVEVKWRHLPQNDPDAQLQGYVLQYKRRVVTVPEICKLHIDNSTKTQLIDGLLPISKYAIRVAGRYENVTGPYTEWLTVRTEEMQNNMTSISTYHVSPFEVLLLWQPFKENSRSSLELIEISSIGRSWGFYKKVLGHITVNDTGVVIFKDLTPDTPYRVLVKEHVSSRCVKYKAVEFKTSKEVAADCFDDCLQEANVTQDRDPESSQSLLLRLIPLPEGKHLITWLPYFDNEKNGTYFYVVRVFGEPFMSQMYTFYIPIGRTYHVINDLDLRKTYSISLQVFDTQLEHYVYSSRFLLVLPTKDLVPRTDYPSTIDLDDVWAPNSMDMLVKHSYLKESQPNTTFDVPGVQAVNGTNWVMLSKLEPNEDWKNEINKELLASMDNDSLRLYGQEQDPPSIKVIPNITVTEGHTVHVTCLSSGDPYPIITWINATMVENQTLLNDKRVMVTSPRHVGSTSYVNHRAYLGTNSFLDIDPVELWDSGKYACASENMAGHKIYYFHVNVLPKPPGPVTHLISQVTTPFEVFVKWLQPNSDRVSNNPATGYRIVVLDEYDVTLREMNTTATKMNIQNLEPDTFYQFAVSAYHEFGEGDYLTTTVRTIRIPVLGPPENVTVTTYNGSTLQVAWLPPGNVRTRQVKLRTYLFRHRKLGDRKAEEMPLDKFTNVSIIDLEAEQRYEIQVLAMSEDAQVSYSEWIQGSTFRENYMDESRPPPPPHNVYLRQESGNMIVSWLPPFPDENILVRAYAIDVLNNGTKRESMEVGYKESSVIVYDAEMGILYQISVKAKNNAGTSIDEWAEIYIPEKYVSQNPVQNFQGSALSSTKLELQWLPPVKGEGVYTHYVLSYIISGETGPALPGGGDLPATIQNYVVRSLKPYTDYFFKITPYLKRTKGVSANTTVKTLSDKPANPPGNITLEPINSTAIVVRCDPPNTERNGVIVTYKISYRTKHTFRSDVIVPAGENEKLKGYMTELLPSTIYEFRIRSMTVNGSGPWSSWYQTQTLAPVPVLPKPPRDLDTQSRTTSIRVSWSPPSQDLDHITGYIIGYGRFIPEVYRDSVTKEHHKFSLEHLDPGSVYIVSVRSFNDYGESEAIFEITNTLSDDHGNT